MNCLSPNYPGTRATPDMVLELAREYRNSAHVLKAGFRKGRPITRAPACFCAMQSIELFLNAFLLDRGMQPEAIRGLQHDFGKRQVVAASLNLRKKTQEHLARLTDGREYLITRYGPESFHKLSEVNRLFATLEEISNKVETSLLTPAQAS